jgi:hypothetical protein
MVRAVVIVALFALAGCGASARTPKPTTGSAPGLRDSQDRRPTSAPPRSPASSAPPPAWVQYSGGSRWLAFDSYCWSAHRHGACADMIGPQMRRDIPTVFLRPGELVRFHLAFIAKSIDLRLGTAALSVLHRRSTAVVAWRAPKRRGRRLVLLDIQAPAAGGSAGYLVRVQAN